MEEEDLQQNPFFQTFQNDPRLSDLYEQAPSSGWVVCVPVAHSLGSANKLPRQVFLGHILKEQQVEKLPPKLQRMLGDKVPGKGERHFSTLNGELAVLHEGRVEVQAAGKGKVERSAKVVYQEQCYNDNFESFVVLVIDMPIYGAVSKKIADASKMRDKFPISVHRRSLGLHMQFVRWLIGDRQADTTLFESDRVARFATDFNFRCTDPALMADRDRYLETLSTEMQQFSDQAHKDLLKLVRPSKLASWPPGFRGEVMVGVSSFVAAQCRMGLFAGLANLCLDDDGRFIQAVKHARHLKLEQVGAPPESTFAAPNDDLSDGSGGGGAFDGAIKQMSLMDSFQTPLDQIGCIRKVVHLIMQCIGNKNSNNSNSNSGNGSQAEAGGEGSSGGKGEGGGEGEQVGVSTDDLLPIFVFVVLKSGLMHPFANLVFMTHFQPEPSLLKAGAAELEYLVASFQAALHYCVSDELIAVATEHRAKLSMMTALKRPPNLFEDNDESTLNSLQTLEAMEKQRVVSLFERADDDTPRPARTKRQTLPTASSGEQSSSNSNSSASFKRISIPLVSFDDPLGVVAASPVGVHKQRLTQTLAELAAAKTVNANANAMTGQIGSSDVNGNDDGGVVTANEECSVNEDADGDNDGSEKGDGVCNKQPENAVVIASNADDASSPRPALDDASIDTAPVDPTGGESSSSAHADQKEKEEEDEEDEEEEQLTGAICLRVAGDEESESSGALDSNSMATPAEVKGDESSDGPAAEEENDNDDDSERVNADGDKDERGQVDDDADKSVVDDGSCAAAPAPSQPQQQQQQPASRLLATCSYCVACKQGRANASSDDKFCSVCGGVFVVVDVRCQDGDDDDDKTPETATVWCSKCQAVVCSQDPFCMVCGGKYVRAKAVKKGEEGVNSSSSSAGGATGGAVISEVPVQWCTRCSQASKGVGDAFCQVCGNGLTRMKVVVRVQQGGDSDDNGLCDSEGAGVPIQGWCKACRQRFSGEDQSFCITCGGQLQRAVVLSGEEATPVKNGVDAHSDDDDDGGGGGGRVEQAAGLDAEQGASQVATTAAAAPKPPTVPRPRPPTGPRPASRSGDRGRGRGGSAGAAAPAPVPVVVKPRPPAQPKPAHLQNKRGSSSTHQQPQQQQVADSEKAPLKSRSAKSRSARNSLSNTPGAVAAWVPDNEADNCMNPHCNKAFSLFLRKHHCRCCGRIFCDACGPFRPNIGLRACDPCFKQL